VNSTAIECFLWRTALRRAGAAEVSFDLGGFELAAADTPRP
jgi:hypothetical protein